MLETHKNDSHVIQWVQDFKKCRRKNTKTNNNKKKKKKQTAAVTVSVTGTVTGSIDIDAILLAVVMLDYFQTQTVPNKTLSKQITIFIPTEIFAA